MKPLNIYYNIKDHNGVTAQVAVSRENRCTGEMSELECSPVLIALKTNQMDRLLYGTPEFRMRQLEEAAENVRLRHKISRFSITGTISLCFSGYFLCRSSRLPRFCHDQ